MATFKSVELTPPVYPMSGPGFGGRTPHGARGTYTITAALAEADRIDLFDLPLRARIVSGFLKSDDLDTGGAPAIVLKVGDSGDDDRYFSGATVGQAGGVTTTLAATGVDYLTTAKTRVFLTVTTAPATGATTGTITCVLNYWVEEPL